VFLGVAKGDTEADADWLARKILSLRIFEDDQGKMNRSVLDVEGDLLVISQFTLQGDCRKGRRPGFDQSAPPDTAIPLYRRFIEQLQTSELTVREGEFGALMDVDLVNHGPVTLIVESPANSLSSASSLSNLP
jgi:D-tyrosyl-tRNA(Tyr) deacylase